MKKSLIQLLFILFGLAFFMSPASAAPEVFDKNLIIYDDEFVDYQSMSASNIQEFLNSRTGILGGYLLNGKSAAEMIFQAAQASKISPKVLLVTLQKEQSLIDQAPSRQRALDYAMGYGCPDSGGCSASTKGFDKQIEFAAKQFRRYLDQIQVQGYTITYWGPKLTKTLTCINSDFNNGRNLCTPGTEISLTPTNNVTAALYTYTPHPGGNYAFWILWNRYNFNLQRFYPDGSLLRAENNPDVWVIQNGVKKRYTNSTAFLSRYTFNRVISVPSDHLLVYETGSEITYANYSLLSSPAGGVYLLVDDYKRPIKTRQAFQNAGFRWDEILKVSWAELGNYIDGEEITIENVYPSGQLLQDNETGGIFFVKDGARYPIVCREIYKSQFGLRKAKPVAPAELDKYLYGKPVSFKDGDLVRSDATVYVISQGLKLAIANPETFDTYRFNWGNINLVSQQCIDAHPQGQVINTDTILRTASN